jgi:hypothetical protein
VSWSVTHADAFWWLPTLAENSCDSIVCDPPAGVAFMGRKWDTDKGGRDQWINWLAVIMSRAVRALKPGAHGLVWALPRTSHWTAMALENAGFEVRDSINHLFGSGFPKSLACGEGLGTALKPSHEVWWLVRKPLEKGLTVAQNLEKWGTGALNIDACRVAHSGAADLAAHQAQVEAIKSRGGSMENSWKNSSDLSGANDVNAAGRWPTNLLFSHSDGCRHVGTRSVKANPTWDTPNRETESSFTGDAVSQVRHGDGESEEVPVWLCCDGCPVRVLDGQSGEHQNGTRSAPNFRANRGGFSGPMPALASSVAYGDYGAASRYFPQFQRSELDDITPFLYAAKPSRSERDAGLDHFRHRSGAEVTGSKEGQARLNSPRSGAGRNEGARNVHPTVKSIDLMRWLVRLVTPLRGVVLDPFTGSGGTGVAAILEGRSFLGCELNDTDEEPFVSIARARLTHVSGGLLVPRESLRDAEPPKQTNLFEVGT